MKNHIGPIFRKCYSSVEDFKSSVESTSVSTTSNFRDEYSKHIEALSIIADCAKIYILENYEKVKDWSDLDLHIESGTDQATGKTHFYKHEADNFIKSKGSVKNINDVFENLNKMSEEGHNPIVSLTDVVLDHTDGDFSLTINGLEFWWIYNNAIITVAHYIEKNLK